VAAGLVEFLRGKGLVWVGSARSVPRTGCIRARHAVATGVTRGVRATVNRLNTDGLFNRGDPFHISNVRRIVNG
jgi:hypothetical protein